MEHKEMPVKDPVCGIYVRPGEAPAYERYQGRTFHFCCRDCLLKFQTDPLAYLRKKVA